jgi:hypothetical protein
MDNYEGHELTAVSLGAVLPQPPERRGEERLTTLLRIGKLVTAGEQRLCMIRNISSAGAMLRLYQPIAVGARVEVEVTPDCPVPALVLWVQDELAGIAFDKPIDVVAALRGTRSEGPYRRAARTPRVQLRRPAMLCTEAVEQPVILCDVSLNGAKLETEEKLPLDSEVALFADGLPPLPGRLRWWRDGRAGIEFDIPLQIDLLADWLGSDVYDGTGGEGDAMPS